MLEVRSEGAVLIRSDSGRYEQTIIEAGLLLEEQAERLHRRRLAVGSTARRRGTHRRAAGRKDRSAGANRVDFNVRIIAANARLEIDPRAEIVSRGARDLRREVTVLGLVVGHTAKARRRRLWRAFVQAAQ